ncbi:PqiC family protein [Acidisoma sp. 7E03]
MISRRRSFLAALGGLPLAAAGLAGCTSPNPNYYRIGTVPGVQLTGGPPSVEVRTISIPGYLDRQGIVKQANDYKLDIHENDIWAEPLAGMLEDTLVSDLQTRLPGTTVIGAGGSIGANADLLVETNVLRFDPDPNGQMVLQFQVGIRDAASMNLLGTRAFTHQAPSGQPVVAQIVAGMSRLWGLAADDIATFLVQSWAAHPPVVSSAG